LGGIAELARTNLKWETINNQKLKFGFRVPAGSNVKVFNKELSLSDEIKMELDKILTEFTQNFKA